MIRNNSEYKYALRQLEGERSSLAENEKRLREMGLNDEQIARGMAPLRTMHQMHVEEVEDYARSLHRDLGSFTYLRDIGRALIGARIGSRKSQRTLAQALGVDESQVSRDERSEYGGVSLDRACDIFDTLGVEVRIDCRFHVADSILPEIHLERSALRPSRYLNLRLVNCSDDPSNGPDSKAAA